MRPPRKGTSLTVGNHFEFGHPAGTPRRRKKKHVTWKKLQVAFSAIAVLSFISTFYVSFRMTSLESLDIRKVLNDRIKGGFGTFIHRSRLVSRIAFGSGTSKNYGPQPVWVRGVIPADPDAWIWVGDMAFMDEPLVSCEGNKNHFQCSCERNWLQASSCMSGNISHAKARVQGQISNPDYCKFLNFMCPGYREKGRHPPIGPDPASCQRNILGTYDDRDYGWQHGDGRLPQKDEMKNVFLDAVGEFMDSPRRLPGRGIEHKHVLNKGRKGREIDILLLDERYYRDPLPCQVRREYCEKIVLPAGDGSGAEYTWCKDFLHGSNGKGSSGSCCNKDEKLFFGWCRDPLHANDSLWAPACDPDSPDYGAKPWVVNRKGQLGEVDPKAVQETDPVESPFCEVLGRQQRDWLEYELLTSHSPLKIIVSPSPLLANPVPQPCVPMTNGSAPGSAHPCVCTGDDWECYAPAQRHLIHLLSRSSGCVVVVSGDFGVSDIKAVQPGIQPYEAHYESRKLRKPIYQVTASGLVEVKGEDYKCRGGKGKNGDPVGTRQNLACDFIGSPAFGLIEVDWERESPMLKIQVRDGRDSEVKLETRMTLHQCASTVS